MNKLDKIRTHISENRKVYIAAGVGVAVGAVAVGAGLYGRQIIVNDALNVSVNSPKTNIVIANLARRGHPGNIIRCVETGEVFASQNRAAEAMEISASTLARHLKGLRDHVGGNTFEYIQEAV